MMQASDHRNRGFGDGRMLGVRNRGHTVEIKNWYEGVTFYKDVKMSEGEAAMVHDLARAYSDPSVDQKRLNTPALALRIMRKNYPALAAPLSIDKRFLIRFVESHPLGRVGNSSKERADAMMQAIVELAPIAFRELEAEVAREHSWRRGRQRTDLREIHPVVVQDDDLLGFIKEIQDLKATIGARNAEITFLKEAKEAEIISLKEAKDAEILSLKEAKEAEIVSLKAAYDAALKAMNAAQEGRDIVMEELYAATVRAAIVSPFKHGFAEREDILQIEPDSDPNRRVESQWMDMCLN